MTINESIIHFDGADKTGKDTLRDLLVKQSEGKYLVYVRSYISQIVYNRIYKRTINEEFFWKRFKEDSDKGDLFFVFKCSKQVVFERFVKHNEKDLHIDDYEQHSKVFDDVITEAQKRNIQVYIFDTSIFKPDETLYQLKHIINTNIKPISNEA